MRVSIRLICCIALCCAAGCAAGEDLSDGGVTSGVDALFGCTVPPCDGPPLPPPADRGMPDPEPEPRPIDMGLTPDPEPVNPDTCDAPGTRIGLCALCNLQSVPEMPETDANCPAIDCGGDVVYEQVSEGEEVVCYVTRRTPLAGNCRALGECHDDPLTFCGEPMREEAARYTPGPCISMMGCQGATPPMVQPAAPGAPCNGVGLCNVEGECTVSDDCAGFLLQGRSEFCEGGEELGGAPYCEFYVEAGRTDCNTFCLNNNWRCARAWNDNGVCVRQNNESGCGEDYDSFVCRCVPL